MGQRISRKRNPYAHIKKTGGKRSGLEVQVAAALDDLKIAYKGEKELEPIPFSMLRARKYHPDFQLPNGIIIEAKGWFKTEDRTKHLVVKHQHPHLDIRFVFSNPNNKIGKKSNTTYGMWCEKYGFKYAQGTVPVEWTKERKK